MTRLGRDSTKATDIPLPGTEIAIGYATGLYAWTPADWDRFPGIPHCTIDVRGTNPTADVLDIEMGAGQIGQAPSWTRAHNKADPDYPAILYCSRASLTPLFNTMSGAGLQIVRDFRLFIATLDGTKTVPDMTGVWGVQYAGSAITGDHYDESLIYDDHWKATPVTTPPPVTPPPSPRHDAPAPPGQWMDGVLIGRGTDGRLWHTNYDSTTGQWSTPVREP